MSTTKVKVFALYDEENLSYWQTIEKYLKTSTKICAWSPYNVVAGDDVQKVVSTELDNAQIILCLVDINFINNELDRIGRFIEITEKLLEQNKEVLGVLIGSCLWEEVLPTVRMLNDRAFKSLSKDNNDIGEMCSKIQKEVVNAAEIVLLKQKLPAIQTLEEQKHQIEKLREKLNNLEQSHLEELKNRMTIAKKLAILRSEDPNASFYKDLLRPFSENEDGPYGFVDGQDEVIILIEYEEVTKFVEGFAWVKKDGLWGKIDYCNDVIIPFKYSGVKLFQEHVIVTTEEEKQGIINPNGNIIIPIQYQELHNSDDRILAKIDNKWGYIDRRGVAIIPIVYDNKIEFQDKQSIVPACHENKWGFIDYNGKIIIDFQYADAKSFSEDLAAVKNIEGKWGYISKKREVKIGFKYDKALPFDNGVAEVTVIKKGNSSSFCINKKDIKTDKPQPTANTRDANSDSRGKKQAKK